MKPYYENELGVIYHGDCLEILPQIEKVDLVLTDPPYNDSNSNIGFKNGYKTINEKWDKGYDPYKIMNISIDIVKDKGSFLFFCSYHLLGKYLTWNKEKLQQIIHWEYITAMPAIAKVYTPSIEYIIWYSRPKYTFNKKNSGRKILRYMKAKGIDHPCPKPVELIENLLLVHSNINDIVLDPFLGSGTTAVAAMKLNRRFIGIEIEEKYCEIAAKRCEQARTGLTPEEQEAGQKLLFVD